MFAYNQSTTGMYYISIYSCMGFPGGLVGKESACSARDAGRLRFSPLVRKIHWRRACNPLLYSCLENPMDRGAWLVTLHRVAKSWTWLKRTLVYFKSSITHSTQCNIKCCVNSWQGIQQICCAFWNFLELFLQISSILGLNSS